MSDTKRNIEEYKKKKPKVKEKLISAIILLVMASMMITTASFAWVVLSVKPEVTNVTTAIASNGNLEIALANGTLDVPGPTQLGDGSISDISLANTKWGNLINLSDPIYGFNQMVLRPAKLNTAALDTSPLFGAEYGTDGRVVDYITSFRYSKWSPSVDGLPGSFKLTDEYGVRAISSTKMAEAAGYAYERQLKIDEANKKLLIAMQAYTDIIANKDIMEGNSEKKFMETLATIMGKYMTNKMNDPSDSVSNPDVSMDDVRNLRDLFRAFDEVLRLEREAMVASANLQLFMQNQGDESKYTPFDEERLIAQKNSLASMGITLSGLSQNLSDSSTLQKNYALLVTLCDDNAGKTSVKWNESNLKAIINSFVNLNTCTVQIKDSNDAPMAISSIGATAAMGFNNQKCLAVITNGVIYNFEQRSGARMTNAGASQNGGKGLKIVATGKRYGFTMDGTIYATINTSAVFPAGFTTDIENAMNKDQGGAVTLQSHETYGFAIDFWVRTNAPGTHLTLEGNILTKTEEIRAMGTDINGDKVELYTLSATEAGAEGESVTVTQDVYKLTGEDGSDVWYYADTHEIFTPDKTPLAKMETIETVIGYDGENRVWENNAFLSTDSTTQGSGSCYVFYVNSPEDLARGLKLMSAMHVAFIDIEGQLLAEAYMDTEHYFDDDGKIIVPLVLSNNSINIGENAEGKPLKGITALEKNVAQLVTAIVYLDGTNLNNKDVLATSDIQGQFNIQFGSSAELHPVSNEELASKEIKVSASVDKTSFDFDNDSSLSTNITVDISGVTPANVKAFFVRKISDTQGLPLDDIINFSDADGDGKWTASYEFKTPGNFVLRSVQIDGVEYDLNERPTVTVAGFALNSLTWSESGGTAQMMTAEKSAEAELYLQFATNDPHRMPEKAEGRFFTADGITVNVPFTYNVTSNTWTGTAVFLTSGEYELQYLVLDGEYYPVEEAFKKTVKINLGMKVSVYSDSPTAFLFGAGVDGKFENGMEDNEENLYLRAVVMDDQGNEMVGLQNVWLYYSLEGYASDSMGFNAEMKWDGTQMCYIGKALSKAGIFNFSRVVIDNSNIIVNATTAPKFEIVSPIPPTFNSGVTAHDYQYSDDGKGKISVLFNDAIAIPGMMGIAVNEKGEEIEITEYTNESEGVYGFIVSGDGTYTLKEIRLWGVYGENQQLCTEENPLVFDLAALGAKKVTVTVVSKISVSINNATAPVVLGKDGSGQITAEMFEAQTLSDKLSLVISDEGGNALRNVKDLTLTYKYTGNSLTYGEYKFNNADDEIEAKRVEYVITFTKQADGKTFVQNSTHELPYAGTYELSKLQFTFDANNDGSVTKTLTYGGESGKSLPTAPVVQCYSKKPTVKITGVSPTSNVRYYTVANPTSTDQLVSGNFNKKIDDYNAAVYIYINNKGGTFDQEPATAVLPKVNLSLSGVPSGVTGTVTVGHATDSQYIRTFNVTNNAASVEIGGMVQGEAGWFGVDKYPVIVPAGKQQIKQIVLEKDGISFNANLSHTVTINNPLIAPTVTYVDIKSIEESFSGTQPSNAYQTNFKLTLPESQTWVENVVSENVVNGSVDTPISSTTVTQYTTRTESGCGGSTTYYTPYTVTTNKYQANVTTITYSYTYTIVGWMVNGVQYKPGEVIDIEEGVTVRPVIVETYNNDRQENTTLKNGTEVIVSAGDKTQSKPSGTAVDSAPEPKEFGWED